MNSKYRPPLAINFVWHPDDHSTHFQNITKFRQYLTRDIDRPFSRELNIPTFLYSSRNIRIVPNQIKKWAKKNIVFLFLSENTLINSNWNEYIENISSEFGIIPVALDESALKHANYGLLKDKNFVRAYNWPQVNYQEFFILMLSHEIYRLGFNETSTTKTGIDSSLKIFLSHAKADVQGIGLAMEIKNFIDNTSIQRFFDTTDISPCFNFDEEIVKNLKESTVIAIGSDKYSSRYWCQREILMAKEERRPIVFVNTLEHYEDRIFPAAVNIPNIHVSHDTSIRSKEILRILIATLLETIRFNYSKILLDYYKEQNWIPENSVIFSRPPEVNQIITLLKNKDDKDRQEVLNICYPEPPVYPEEISWINHFESKSSDGEIINKIQARTPLWSISDIKQSSKNIGISISDYKEDQYEKQNQHIDELKRLSQVLAGHLLSRKHKLIYGGDLREDGFTQFILDEALIIQNRIMDNSLRVENHLAWPLFIDPKVKSFKAKYHGILHIEEYDAPNDIPLNNEVFLPPNCSENLYIWSRSLTNMRELSIRKSDLRIISAGKSSDYKGKMPGVLEEFIISMKIQKPIYLLGGFGGITNKITTSIINQELAPELTEEWQIQNNAGYAKLQEISTSKGFGADYSEVKNLINSTNIEILANNTGLSTEEYKRLMITPFIDEAVHLILKGLTAISTSQ
ncbi:TIR domain-containing protein [Acinetobacter zhairhuonensis]|uniref:TIR domain-containing protein n=1 Tax=Acinetobacter sp. A7.4 TaxID=2919921 RepID=UPI001F4F7114|nr:TIR domain-containing protein [Acinetobacter sp. A7.4]MCJ8161998.1 TIR domain-containing protein [Acinetobacter sp. A7.4]